MEVPYVVQMEQRRKEEQFERDNPAGAIFKELKQQIKQFRAGLDDGEGLVVQLNNSFGVLINVQTIGYANPSLIYFNGETADGNFAQVIQSVSQLNFGLVAVTLKPGEEKQPIGFVHPEN